MQAEQYVQIKLSVKRLLNIDLTDYKEEQMHRRLDSWLVRSGVSDWEEYLKLVRSDQNELTRFRNYLTINVTEFFRDLERWHILRDKIMPELLSQRPSRGLRIWSAGCSIGAEPYSLAFLLHELSPHQRHYLLATDLDRAALARAKERGPFLAEEVRNVPPEARPKYFELINERYFVRENLASRVTFREHNLLSDVYENQFDLIVCRNVIIYFTAEAKSGLYKRFEQALRPCGFLFLGGTEIIPRAVEIGLRNVNMCSFYIKTGG